MRSESANSLDFSESSWSNALKVPGGAPHGCREVCFVGYGYGWMTGMHVDIDVRISVCMYITLKASIEVSTGPP